MGMNYASLKDRAFAFFIDSIVIVIAAFLFSLLFTLLGLPYLLYLFIATIGPFAYFFFFEWLCGQTIGKIAMKIEVVGKRKVLGFKSAFLRTLFRIIDAIPGVYIVGALLILFSKENQRLGDIIAKTYVVKVK